VLSPGVVVVHVRDQGGQERGPRTDGGGDAEMDQLTADQHQACVSSGHHSHDEEDDS
jgi:hypothetical protein